MNEAFDAVAELLGRRPVLLAFDFDGVLAPIIDVPSAARALDGTGSLLAALAAAPGVHVALVSGRALADLRTVSEVTADTRLLLVGSHGAEFGAAASDQPTLTMDDAARAELTDVTSMFERIAADHPGARVETKPTGIVLHTRQAGRGDAVEATSAALAFVAERAGSHVTVGKEVVEVSVVETGKGVALEQLRSTLKIAAVLYVGDDVTDENAFAVLRPGDVGIKVGHGPTRATHRLPDPAAVQELLRVAVDRTTAVPPIDTEQ